MPHLNMIPCNRIPRINPDPILPKGEERVNSTPAIAVPARIKYGGLAQRPMKTRE
jgi:hypothetical protein